MVPWCSGLTCGPVKAEIAGSNPVGAACSDNFVSSHQVVFIFPLDGVFHKINFDKLLVNSFFIAYPIWLT